MTPPVNLARSTLFWLGFVGIVGPMAIDLYLPALPAMAQTFGTTAATVQLGLAMTTLGMATGTFVVGTLSDRFGRRLPLIFTGILMVVSASLAAFSMHVAWFFVCAFLMGLAASAVQVSGRGVIADLTHGHDSTRAFSIFNSIIMVGPIFGPVGGVLLLQVAGWRGIFVGLAAIAAVGTIGVWSFVPESLPPEKRHASGFGSSLRAMGASLRDNVFRWYGVLNLTIYAVMFTYLGTCSLTFQVELGAPAWVAAVAFAVNGATLVLSGMVAARLSRKVRAGTLLTAAIVGQILGLAYLGVSIVTSTTSIASVFITYFVICASLGLSFGPITTLALTHVRKSAGTALGLMGLTQFITASVTSVLVGTINPSPTLSMLMIGAVISVIAVTSLIGGHRALVRHPDPDAA